MKQAKRIEDLLREFGITIASGKWNYGGISVLSHAFIDLTEAWWYLNLVTTRGEYSKICIIIGDSPSVLLNSTPPLCIQMEDGDGEEADDLLEVVTGSSEWEVMDLIQGFYVLKKTQNNNFFPNLHEN